MPDRSNAIACTSARLAFSRSGNSRIRPCAGRGWLAGVQPCGRRSKRDRYVDQRDFAALIRRANAAARRELGIVFRTTLNSASRTARCRARVWARCARHKPIVANMSRSARRKRARLAAGGRWCRLRLAVRPLSSRWMPGRCRTAEQQSPTADHLLTRAGHVTAGPGRMGQPSWTAERTADTERPRRLHLPLAGRSSCGKIQHASRSLLFVR